MATWKVAPALAAGCCCVLKPSEVASVTSLELAAIAQEASIGPPPLPRIASVEPSPRRPAEQVGLPAGVLNVVTGLGSEAGAALAKHPGIAKVAFTGARTPKARSRPCGHQTAVV